MKEHSIKASIDSIESMGLLDGPGIRTVIFFNGCNLRCMFCHNPETWSIKDNNYTVKEIADIIIRNKPYYGLEGGVTFSGGEPLLHSEFIIEVCKLLKKENIHIALDTAGIGGKINEILLQYIDLVILDIKNYTKEGFEKITTQDKYNEYLDFIRLLTKYNKPLWLRQVIIPGINDNKKYINGLVKFIKDNFVNVKKIEFLPFHHLGFSKYEKLKINNPLINTKEMDSNKVEELYDLFIEEYKKAR